MGALRIIRALRPVAAALALSLLLLASSTSDVGTSCTNCRPSLDDEVSLLQVWNGLNLGNALSYQYPASITSPVTVGVPITDGTSMAGSIPGGMPINLQSLTAPQANAVSANSLAAVTEGLQNQFLLQQLQGVTNAADMDRRDAETNTANSRDVSKLQSMVEDLKRKADQQAGVLEKQERREREELQYQRISTQVVDFATKDAQQARQSEKRAWEMAALQRKKDKVTQAALEGKIQNSKQDLGKLFHTQQLEWRKSMQLMQQVTSHATAQQREHRALELLALQSRQSEKKAWDLAKMQTQKLQAEETTRLALLAQTKAELSDAKNEINKVQAEAAEAFKKEVDQAREEVNREADGRIQRERAEVKSVVMWAQNVQKEAQDQLKRAQAAQRDAATQVTWATAAQREAANAASALQQVVQVQMKTQEFSPNDAAQALRQGIPARHGF